MFFQPYFIGRHGSSLYTLPQLHRVSYTQFLVMLYSIGAWLRRYIFEESCHSWILSWYRQHIFWTFRQGLWYIVDRLVNFRVLSLSLNLDYLEPMLYPVDSLLRWRLSLKLHFYLVCIAVTTFARYYRQQTISFFTIYGWWELKLRYCPVKVGFQYIDDLNLCSVLI